MKTVRFAPFAVGYGNVEGSVVYQPLAGVLSPGVGVTAGVKLEPLPLVDVYVEGNARYTGAFAYYARVGGYVSLLPQLKVGVRAGYEGAASAGSFTVALAAEFAEKPGSLGMPGSYLPSEPLR